jgi:hypothetical protein
MASERGQQEALPAQEVVPAEVERALVELLGCYKGALRYAVDMPALGRSKVSGAAFPWRWGARFYTRLYVETHMRKHLQAIQSRLRLELLGTTAPAAAEQLEAMEADLGGKVEPLLGWRRLAGVIIRLPPVAAALPVLSALAALPARGETSWPAVRNAVVALVATALVLWLLVVWPSIRLGFRIKRAIFCGGRDLHHPIWYTLDELRWEGFASQKVYDDAGKLWVELFRELTGRKRQPTARRAFPTSNVYQAEDALYRALGGRRKPGEVPVDMLLGLALYLWFALSGLLVVGVVRAALSGFEIRASAWFVLFLAVMIPLLSFQLLLQAMRNYRLRPH